MNRLSVLYLSIINNEINTPFLERNLKIFYFHHFAQKISRFIVENAHILYVSVEAIIPLL